MAIWLGGVQVLKEIENKMKKILLILFIGCTLQCIAQHHRDFDTEKEFLEFLTKITFERELIGSLL